ncbi:MULTISPECIES: zf-HC2 domain-containing protein [Methylocaldum]|jgi:hypothetical protein|uniref:zf-HC2 domain-containing protein n=1 Tax=unclassified Methylocaldum TaxID=2622260 RepID=UPI00105D8B4E|nr:zf-HC2 domain-containing protein [Methylocaldum sp. BRCS4]
MRSCREVSELVSKSLDVHLSLRERMAVRLHLMMCRHCSNFKKQMLFLRRAGASYVEYLEKTGRKESVKR